MNALEKYAAKKKLAQTLGQRFQNFAGKIQNFGMRMFGDSPVGQALRMRRNKQQRTIARGLRDSTPTPQERAAKMSLPDRGRLRPSVVPTFGGSLRTTARPASPARYKVFRSTGTLKPPSGGVGQSLPPLPPPIKPMGG